MRPYKAAIVGGGNAKALTLSDFDDFLDWAASGGGDDGSDRPVDLYRAVAWTFWCVNRRANAVSGMPYLVFPMEVEEDDPDRAIE